MKKSLILLAALSAALFSTGAQAGHWKFDVVNKSNTAAVEFRTQENGEWSHNWIENRIESKGEPFTIAAECKEHVTLERNETGVESAKESKAK